MLIEYNLKFFNYQGVSIPLRSLREKKGIIVFELLRVLYYLLPVQGIVWRCYDILARSEASRHQIVYLRNVVRGISVDIQIFCKILSLEIEYESPVFIGPLYKILRGIEAGIEISEALGVCPEKRRVGRKIEVVVFL